MLKQTITYTDFNGVERSEDFYFNLTKAELVELEMGHAGGLSESLQKIVAAEDGGAIIREFKTIILKAYGKRSEDGSRFIKNDKLREEFETSEAYSALFIRLVTDADAAAQFVSGIMPQDLMAKAQVSLDDFKKDLSPELSVTSPKGGYDGARTITQAEAAEMDAAELQAGLSSGALRFENAS